jgi:outer membrane protein assembly factor BamB
LRIYLFILSLLAVALPGAAEERHYSLTNFWQAAIGYYPQSSPALAPDGAIYVTTWDGRLLSFTSEGKARWSFRFGTESVSSPALSEDGTVYFGARNRRIYAVDAQGKKRWSFKTGGWVDASAAISKQGIVYFGSWDGKFYAFRPDGSKQWEFVTGGPVVSSAAIDAAGVIYFGSHDGKFYALKPDGQKQWEYVTRGPITCSPAIGPAGEIYFGSTDGKFYALNPDGTRRWELPTGGVSAASPVLGEDGTVFVSVNQTHCAISSAGKFKWQRPFWTPQPGELGESAAAVLSNGHVVFTGGDGYAMTVPGDAGDTEWIWNYWFYGPTAASPLVGPDGMIYVVGPGTGLTALKRDIPLANTTWPMFRGDPQHTGRVREKQ